VWIDNFLSKPETHLDRTMGRWTNLMVTLRNTPTNLRNRIHVRGFDVGKPAVENCPLPEEVKGVPDACYQPQKHGDFANGPFWNTDYWQSRPPTR